MLKTTALLAAGLLLATAAPAQQAPSGMSDTARQLLQDNLAKRDSDLAPLVARKRDLQKQFDALLTTEGYDEEKLASTMAEMRSVEGAIVERTGESMLALLKTLPEEDRGAFFKTLRRSAPAPRAAPEPGNGR